MIRLAATRSFRLVLALAVIFCLIYGPVCSLNPGRAESHSPTRHSRDVQPITKSHKRGELIIRFKDEAPKQLRDQVIATYAKSEKKLRGRGKESKLTVKDGLDLAVAISELKQLDRVVEFAEPNYVVIGSGGLGAERARRPERSRVAPNDPQFAAQWALSDSGQGSGRPVSGIGAVAGWRKTTGSRDTVVAVIDTGVDINHPDLAGNIWVNRREDKGDRNKDDDYDGFVDDVNGWNFVSDNEDVADDHGHGTAIAGIIAAEGDNRQGIAGVMWRASVMPLKALDRTGSGAVSDVVEAMDFAVGRGAQVINCSFGTEAPSQALFEAIKRAERAGVVVVASAGNGGQDLAFSPQYPAGFNAGNLISVAATDNRDHLAQFSNYGAAQVHVGAPGVDILTTRRGGGYATVTGASAAAPVVAGVAGLLKTELSWVSAQSVRQGLIEGARKAPALDGRVLSGGVVDIPGTIAAFLSKNGGGNGDVSGGGKIITSGKGAGGPKIGYNNVRHNRINLKYMRNNQPSRAKLRVMANNLRTASYKVSAPTGRYPAAVQTGFSGAGNLQNAVGRPGSTVGREGDPTIANNATGGQSLILGSQNFNFSAPVLSLGGRGGLGIDLNLSYNSNSAWIKDFHSNTLIFNFESDLSAGWNIGFGKLIGENLGGLYYLHPIWDQALGAFTYIWVEPDGTRRTLVGTSQLENDIYRSIDSSHIEFEYHVGGGRNSSGVGLEGLLKLKDGTQISLLAVQDSQWGYVLGKMVPIQIKDRNGNYITITYDFSTITSNLIYPIDKITDSMGREIDFYYENGLLREVRQNRGGTWHVFVRLHYAPITINTSFTVPVFPMNINGQTAWMPWFIEYPGIMNYRIFYTSYCQAYQIEKWAPTISGQGGERPVAFTWYDLPSINGQSMPGGAMRAATNNGVAHTECPRLATREEWAENWSRDEAGWVPSGGYMVARYSYHLFSDGVGTHTRITDPIGRIYRTDISVDGLTHISRVWADGSSYGSDGSPGTPLKTTTTIYQNAGDGLRPGEVTVTDGSSSARKTISYTTLNWISLPQDVSEYENGGSTEYRRTTILYKTDAAYLNRNMIGMPAEEIVSDPAQNFYRLRWKVFSYDEPAYFDGTDFSVVQHDSTNYGTGFVFGRGNLTTVNEYDPQTGTWRMPTRTTYNKTGMVTSVTDAASHTTQFFYEDNFSVPASPPSGRALVTRVKDPDGYWGGAKYNWYTGLPVETYHIAGTSGTGAHENIMTRAYDGMDRLSAVTTPTGQTNYTYWDNWLAVATYTLIDTAKTRYDVVGRDGAGNMNFSGGDHPDGVSGKYRGAKFGYDAVGRMIKSTNPTEIDVGSNPIGDDAATGFLWSQVQYDALDRKDHVTLPDGNSGDFAYSGCNCAGNSTVTVADERGKKRKLVYDFLGRLKEAHNLASSGVTYSKAVYTYDKRDLLTKIEHYDGGGAHQDRTFVYDGYGRLVSQTTPEAGTRGYTYYINNWVHTVRNDRIVAGNTFHTATFTYNNRGLVTGIGYNDGSTPSASFGYDEYGARISMNDGVGSATYAYDQHRRLQTETRSFNGLNIGTIRIDYEWNNANGLKGVTYAAGAWTGKVNYGWNNAGSLTGVGTDLISGAASNNATNVVNQVAYRSSGVVKSALYGNGRSLAVSYDAARQQVTRVKVWTPGRPTEETIIDAQYDYYNGGGNNGQIQRITDHVDSAYSTTFTYDDQRRLASAKAGAGAPYTYERNYSYDAWGNLKQVSGTGGENPNYTISYATNASGAPATNQIGNAGYIYDAAGNLKQDTWNTYSYNAANLLKEVGSGGQSTYKYDGDGKRASQMAGGYGPLFYLWSSVLNQPVLELTGAGVYRAYVYDAGGATLGLLSCDYGFYWVHRDHQGSGRKLTDVSGHVVYRVEMDPHGQTIYETADNGQTFLNPRKYATYQRDWESNLDYARARMYHHNLGRFSQPDAAGMIATDITDPQSLNQYAYVQNDPVNKDDKEGLCPTCPKNPYDRWMNPWNYLSPDMREGYNKHQEAVGRPEVVPAVALVDGAGNVIQVLAYEIIWVKGKQDDKSVYDRVKGFFEKWIDPWIPSSVGGAVEGNASVGMGLGYQATGSAGVGLFSGRKYGFGGYASGGRSGPDITGHDSSPETVIDNIAGVKVPNLVLGANAGANVAWWFSNARTPEELSKTNNTLSVNAGVALGVDIHVGFSISYGNGIYHISINPPGPKTGIGAGMSITKQTTKTVTF